MIKYSAKQGTLSAKHMGCTCPFYGNRCGNGITIQGKVCFFISKTCPIHNGQSKLNKEEYGTI